MSPIRQEPKVISCLLFQYKGGEDILIGEYADYDTAYKVARDVATRDPSYRVFKTIETFTRVRECSFNRHRREDEQELLAGRDAEAKARAKVLTELSDEQLNMVIQENGLDF